MASKIEIFNRALQLLGAQRAAAVSDTTNNATACRDCYDALREKLLRSYRWKFAIRRAALAADDPAPTWGRDNSFTLPSDYMLMAPDYQEDATLALDYEIEEGKILSDMTDPLYIRYVANIENVNTMDPIFRELLAHEMAVAMCEKLTQSKTKKESIAAFIPGLIRDAKRSSAIEGRSQVPLDSEWTSCRS